MKITIQDLTVIAVGIVASASLFSIGYAIGMATEIGFEYLPWLLPSGVYDAATTALRPSWYYPLVLIGTQLLISIGSSSLFGRNPQMFFSVIIMLLVSATTIALVSFSSVAFLQFALYAAVAIFLAALITDHFQQGHVLMLLLGVFAAFASLGIIDGGRQAQASLETDQRINVAATDRNYVNARLVHSTVGGVVLKSGNQIIFYPMDKIIRITREK